METFDLTSAACEDLYRIWEYTFDTWSEAQADKYYASLKEAFLNIASSPLSIGKPYDSLYLGLRGYHVGRHIVFYLIRDNGRVLIVRILHEKMDYGQHLNG